MEITRSMYYAIFDSVMASASTPDYPPILDIDNPGAIKKKISSRKYWYDEYKLCLVATYAVTTHRGKYIAFQLKDYGIFDYGGIAFTIDDPNGLFSGKEYYHIISYDIDDCIILCAPYEGDVSLKAVSLQITAACYAGSDIKKYVLSQPNNLSKALKQQISIIENQRNQYAISTNSDSNGKIKLSKKLPYEDTFMQDAWLAYPDAVQFLRELEIQCNELDQLISELPMTIHDIDIAAPAENDDVIIVPLECTYNQKFFARLYLARKHIVCGRIISAFDMVQFQIPIKSDNEPLLLCLHGSHWLGKLLVPPESEVLGDDQCSDIYEKAASCSPIFSIIKNIRNHLLMQVWCPIIRKSSVGQRYSELISSLNSWIEQRTREAIKLSEEIRPSLWKSEYRLYQYAKLLCPQAIYQYRSDWLEAQSLDVFIPQYQCAIEYQGEQHYTSVDYFGGDTAFIERQKNDEEKRKKCKSKGIRLLEWPYQDKLYFSSVLKFFNENVFAETVEREYVEDCLKRGLPFLIEEAFLPVTYAKMKVAEQKKDSLPLYEIRKYNQKGEFLAAYESLITAANAASVSTQQISKAINGRAESAGGFLWLRANVEDPIIPVPPLKEKTTENISKAIFQIDTNGEIIAEYESINAAEKQTGVNRKSIRDVIRGRQRTAGGFFWALKEIQKENT